MDHIAKRYNILKIRHIYLLADGGNWIRNGLHELKLYAQNKPQFCLCEFHFKQAINHISSDKDERKNLLEIFNTKPFELTSLLLLIQIEKKPSQINSITLKITNLLLKECLIWILVHLLKAIFLILLLPCLLSDPKDFLQKELIII